MAISPASCRAILSWERESANARPSLGRGVRFVARWLNALPHGNDTTGCVACHDFQLGNLHRIIDGEDHRANPYNYLVSKDSKRRRPGWGRRGWRRRFLYWDYFRLLGHDDTYTSVRHAVPLNSENPSRRPEDSTRSGFCFLNDRQVRL
jgi:hypothetical protein